MNYAYEKFYDVITETVECRLAHLLSALTALASKSADLEELVQVQSCNLVQD
jgi:hypothetical protein